MPEELPTASRYLVVVRRDNATVFETLKRDWAEPGVEIIWDRRGADRRRTEQPVQLDRRREERRGIPPVIWTTLGFLLTPVQSTWAERSF